MVGHPPRLSNGDGLVPRRINLVIKSNDNLYQTLSFLWNNMMDGSKEWQDGVYYTLCACSALLALIGLIQLVCIHMRVPDWGWTTQKVFQMMNCIVNALRAFLFGFYKNVSQIKPRALEIMVIELPGLLFFSTYTLLVLFWAEIYRQANSLPSNKLRPIYYIVNGAVYLIQIMIWICLGLSKSTVALRAAKVFLSVISLIAALGFLVYGVRLFFMIRSFPMESKGRQKKLYEVSYVAVVCCTCFLGKCAVAAVSGFLDDDLNLEVDVLSHPLANLLYYMLNIGHCPMESTKRGVSVQVALTVLCAIRTVEIVPSALVLFILRKLPPKRHLNQKPMQYQTEWD